MLVVHRKRLDRQPLERQNSTRLIFGDQRVSGVESLDYPPPDRGRLLIPPLTPQRDGKTRERVSARDTIAAVGRPLITGPRVEQASRLLVDAAQCERFARIGAGFVAAAHEPG